MSTKDANDSVLEVSPLIIRGKEPYADYWCSTQMRTVKVSYLWTIKDFSSLISKKIDVVFTEEFSSKDTPHVVWKMVLKIDSDYEDLQLELHHVKKETISYPIFLKAQISILNAESERKHTAASFEGLSEEKNARKASISKDLLMENPDELLPRNSLTLYCEILQSGYFNIQKDKNVPVYEDRMSDDISKLFENSFFTDAVIDVQGTLFKVHKAVLAARCRVFWAMFKPDSNMREQVESVVKIDDIQPTVFREILRYIYANEAEITESIVYELMIAADKYGMEGLKIICEKTLYDIMKVQNAMHILEYANQLEINQLKQKVLKFIKSNLADVMKSKSWNEVLVSDINLATDILEMHISD